MFYDFKILKATDFFDNDSTKFRTNDGNPITMIEEKKFMLKKKIKKTINHAQIMAKIRYDFKHKSLNLESGQKVYIKLHKNYNQSDLTNRKFSKQKIKSITILKKMENLTYKLNVFLTWKIHPIISVIQLKSAFLEKNPYEKKTAKPDPIKTEDDNDAEVYEVKKIVAKKMIYTERNRRRRVHSEFKIKWLNWKNQHNRWMKKKNLNDCKKLLKKFENNDHESNHAYKEKNRSNENDDHQISSNIIWLWSTIKYLTIHRNVNPKKRDQLSTMFE